MTLRNIHLPVQVRGPWIHARLARPDTACRRATSPKPRTESGTRAAHGGTRGGALPLPRGVRDTFGQNTNTC